MPFDYAGLGIFFPAVVLLLAAISFGADLGWISPLIIGLLLAAVALAGWFIRHERAESDPMMDLSLFAERRFSFGILSGVGSYLVMFGVLLLIPFYVERGLGGGVARVDPERKARCGPHENSRRTWRRVARPGTPGAWRRSRRQPASPAPVHRSWTGSLRPETIPASRKGVTDNGCAASRPLFSAAVRMASVIRPRV